MTTTRTMLVIDDEVSICSAFRRFFSKRGWEVHAKATGKAGLAAYEELIPDLVFLDVRLPDTDGLQVLNAIRERDRGAVVVIITAYGSLETIAEAVKGKAYDFLPKPIDLDRADEIAERAIAEVPAGGTASAPAETMIVGQSRVMQEVYKRIGLVAQSDSAVLILGETGTGKELVARAIHRHSPRRDGPFVPVNCGALPDNLVESELFGHEKGAFTGADASKPGKLEAAHNGTLFLDEIGELPLSMQVKLLRVLDSQVVERLGSLKARQLNVRILAATNRSLRDEVEAGRFRRDLYFRLNVIQIELPRLIERRDDVLPLARHFLHQLTKTSANRLSEAACMLLQAFDWPGNVRELRNAIEHAVVVSGGANIMPDHLPESIRGSHGAGFTGDALADYTAQFEEEADLYNKAVTPLERALIESALTRSGGSQSEAAEILGLHRNTLRRKIRELGIDVSRFKANPR